MKQDVRNVLVTLLVVSLAAIGTRFAYAEQRPSIASATQNQDNTRLAASAEEARLELLQEQATAKAKQSAAAQKVAATQTTDSSASAAAAQKAAAAEAAAKQAAVAQAQAAAQARAQQMALMQQMARQSRAS